MADVQTPEAKGGKTALGLRKRKRVGVRVDMTPMVDVAFLLLIFFMVTTVFRTPQALEINLPPDRNAHVDVNQEKVLTITVLQDDRSYWRRAKDPWARTEVAKLGDVFKTYKGNKDVIVLIKIDREAKFNNMVKIIDDLDQANLTRFSLQELSPEEKKEVAAL
jgi:biopolymer transport protein ExbD